jgi:hypothetical protein
MRSRSEKGGGSFAGIKLLLCENPLPPIEEAIAAAQAEVPRSNYYTEAHSAPLRRLIAAQLGVPERLIHINAGSGDLQALRRSAGGSTCSRRPTRCSARSRGTAAKRSFSPSAASPSTSPGCGSPRARRSR